MNGPSRNLAPLAAAALASLASPAAAKERIPLFACAIGSAEARADAVDERLVYTFRRNGRTELRVVGDSQTVFWRRTMMAAPVSWLRFQRGPYSYVVHHHASDISREVRGSSGVTVFRRSRIIARLACDRETPFNPDFDPDPILVEPDDLAWSPY